MIKNILAVGDSFTYGEELDDVNNAYPYVLARQLGANITNLAKPGSGNTRMVRYIIESISKNKDIDLVIIAWSSAGRMEFADACGPYDIWPGYSGNMFRAGGQEWRMELLKYINTHHNTSYIYEKYLLDIIMIQSFLKQQNIDEEYFSNVFFEHTLSFSVEQLNLLNTFIAKELESVAEQNYDYILVSLFSYLAWPFGEVFLPQLRKVTHAKIVIGGAGASTKGAGDC